MAVERHLVRVAERLPSSADGLAPSSDASDAVILHMWQATGRAVAHIVPVRAESDATLADALTAWSRAT